MTGIFEGASRDDDPGIRFDRLARMAEAGNWLHCDRPVRRRRHPPFWPTVAASALLAAALMAGLTAAQFIELPF